MMMTDVTAILPAAQNTSRPAGADDTCRASRSAQTADTTDRQSPVERTDNQPTDAITDNDVRHSTNADARSGDSFEDTLKKRLEKDNDDKADNEKDNTDDKTDLPVAIEAAAVSETIRRAPVVIKSINPKSQGDNSQTRGNQPEMHGNKTPLILKTASSRDERFGVIIKKGLVNKDRPAEAVEVQNKPAEKIVNASPTSTKETESLRETGDAEKLTEAVEKNNKSIKNDKNVKNDTSEITSLKAANNKEGLPVEKPQSKPPTSDDKAVAAAAHNARIPRTDAVAKDDGQTPKSTGDTPKSSLKKDDTETLDDNETAKTQNAVKAAGAIDLKESAAAQKTPPPDPAVESLTATAPSSHNTSAASATTTQAAEAVKSVEQPGASRPIDQIVQNLQLRTFGADTQVRMTLAPEELGAIRMTFRQDSGGVVGVLEVQRNETRREVEQSIGQLTASMENAGVQVRRIEVVPWSSGNPSARNDATGSDADAAARQQMMDNQSGGEQPSRRKVHEDAGNPRNAPAPSKSPYRNDTSSESGLNVYL